MFPTRYYLHTQDVPGGIDLLLETSHFTYRHIEPLPLHLRHLRDYDHGTLNQHYRETHGYVNFVLWDVLADPLACEPVAVLMATVAGWDIWYPDAARPGEWIAGPATNLTNPRKVLCQVWRELYGDPEAPSATTPLIGTVPTLL